MRARKTPAWYWAVAGLALVWNAYGCLDFALTAARSSAYLAAFPPDYVAYLDTLPLWLFGYWAAGVGGALLGSVLLLVRSRWAPATFALSLVGLLVTTLYQRSDETLPASVSGGLAGLMLSLVIWTVALALLVFALRMRRAGILR